MEHAVLGAGAIGGLVGTAIASLGEGVTVLVRAERLAGYPANLSLERPSGDRHYGASESHGHALKSG